MKKFKNAIRACAFMGVLCVCLLWVQGIVTPNRDWPASIWRMPKNLAGLLNEKKNTLDILWVGTSHLALAVSPMEIYRDTGLYSHQINGPAQRIAAQYYLLRETMKRQSPKLVVLDASAFFYSEEQLKGKSKWEESIDALPIANMATRVEMGLEAARLNGDSFDDSYIEMTIFPILRYHTEYKAPMTEYIDRHLEQVFHRKGYVASDNATPVDETQEGEAGQAEIDEEDEGGVMDAAQLAEAIEANRYYLDRIKALCDAQGSELLFIKVPVNAPDSYSGHWSDEKHALAGKLSEEMNVPFLDLNYEDVGIDWQTDTGDRGRHLNVRGALKASRFMSNYLKAHYSFAPHTDEALEAQWKRQLELYDREIGYYRLRMIKDVWEYLDAMEGEGKTCLICSYGVTGDWWSEELQQRFAEVTGCELDLGDPSNVAVALESSGGKAAVLKADSQKARARGTLPGGVPFTINAGGGEGASNISIKLGDVSLKEKKGLMIVVYDDELACPVDHVLIKGRSDGSISVTQLRGDFEDWFRLNLMDYIYKEIGKF